MISGLESPWHLLIILVIALVVLGPRRLPDAGRALGGAIRNFREAIATHDDDPPLPSAAPPARRAGDPERSATERRDPSS